MSRSKAISIIGFCTVVGLAIGVAAANWTFTDPDVLRAARLLAGGFGMAVGGFGSKWLLLANNGHQE
jgi:hypothetical protein